MAAPEQWWAVPEGSAGIDISIITGHASVYHVVSSAGKPASSASEPVYGPFKTRAQAQRQADQLNGIAQSGAGAGEKAAGISNPLSGIEQVGHWLGELVSHLTDGPMWRSIGWMLLGVLCIFTGILLWIKQNTGSLPAPLPVPV